MNEQPKHPAKTFVCPSCRLERPMSHKQDGRLVPARVAAAIEQKHPHWTPDFPVCRECVNVGKAEVAQEMIEADLGEVGELEAEVVASIRADRLLAQNYDDTLELELTGLDRAADFVTNIVGSWTFAALICTVLGVWLTVNLIWRPFEPYPMIVFGVLSTIFASLAAIQGPIILMSQRRQRRLDRLRSENEYRINLKAELEIQYLDEKIEQLLRIHAD